MAENNKAGAGVWIAALGIVVVGGGIGFYLYSKQAAANLLTAQNNFTAANNALKTAKQTASTDASTISQLKSQLASACQQLTAAKQAAGKSSGGGGSTGGGSGSGGSGSSAAKTATTNAGTKQSGDNAVDSDGNVVATGVDSVNSDGTIDLKNGSTMYPNGDGTYTVEDSGDNPVSFNVASVDANGNINQDDGTTLEPQPDGSYDLYGSGADANTLIDTGIVTANADGSTDYANGSTIDAQGNYYPPNSDTSTGYYGNNGEFFLNDGAPAVDPNDPTNVPSDYDSSGVATTPPSNTAPTSGNDTSLAPDADSNNVIYDYGSTTSTGASGNRSYIKKMKKKANGRIR